MHKNKDLKRAHESVQTRRALKAEELPSDQISQRHHDEWKHQWRDAAGYGALLVLYGWSARSIAEIFGHWLGVLTERYIGFCH
jgi:hypothetical protein